MVKFGRHLQFFVDLERHDDGSSSIQHRTTTSTASRYIVPYNVLRDAIQSPVVTCATAGNDLNNITPDSFISAWKEAFVKANRDYTESINLCWRGIFDFISSYEQEEQHNKNNCIKPKFTARGMELMDAIKVYTQINDVATSRDLLNFLKDIYNAAEINYQALRKIVKKFDKKYHNNDKDAEANGGGSGRKMLLSPFLLPELYSSSLFVGRGTLNITISYLRESIEELTSSTSNSEEDSIGSNELNKSLNPTNMVAENDDGAIDEESQVVMKRNEELQWLNNTIKKIPQSELRHIVAHRGFHNPQDRSDNRPLENSLSAFETCWSAGIHLCECDVALTKDEKLVLAHDENFSRLALDRSSTYSRLKVSELTFKELIALTLKNGVRAPLLKDVLMSANAIGPEAKLIVEIKPGNREAAKALSRLLLKYPELIAHVAVIMSFDLWSMHSLCADLQGLFPNRYNANKSKTLSLQHQYQSTSIPGTSPSKKLNNNLVDYSTHQKDMFPKLMLLTVADQPEKNFELCTNVSDYSQIDEWLNGTNTFLDGVYVRYEPEMMSPEGKEALQKLAKKCAVGVWAMVGEDPDDYETMQYLVNDCGVSFYNTDLPRTF